MSVFFSEVSELLEGLSEPKILNTSAMSGSAFATLFGSGSLDRVISPGSTPAVELSSRALVEPGTIILSLMILEDLPGVSFELAESGTMAFPTNDDVDFGKMAAFVSAGTVDCTDVLSCFALKPRMSGTITLPDESSELCLDLSFSDTSPVESVSFREGVTSASGFVLVSSDASAKDEELLGTKWLLLGTSTLGAPACITT